MSHTSSPAPPRAGLSRRGWLRLSAAGLVGRPLTGWLRGLAADAATYPGRRRSCILLWMAGGPSQLDTFDPKPGHRNGGPFRAIATPVPGIRVGECLPQVARHIGDVALVRSMCTREPEHQRATHLLQTGRAPQDAVRYPLMGAAVARELGDPDAALPNFVSIGDKGTWPDPGPGFLGPRHAPLVLGSRRGPDPRPGPGDVAERLRVPFLDPPAGVRTDQAEARARLARGMAREFVARHPDLPAQSHQAAYDQALRLMRPDAARAFDLAAEPARVRDRYGRSLFGQGCLLARRLVERGVPFVEAVLDGIEGAPAGWDTHADNFNQVRRLCAVLDAAWAALLEDLRQRGLLETTLVVWMGEFGRTPVINRDAGRDHHVAAWTVALAGGGIRGGRVVGKTGADGMAVEERPVSVPDLLATVCLALGIDPARQNRADGGRPIRIVEDGAHPLREVLA
jgi:hypothetical protein